MKTVQSPFHFCLVSQIIIIFTTFEIMIECCSKNIDMLYIPSVRFVKCQKYIFIIQRQRNLPCLPLLLFRKRCPELILYVTIDTHAVLLPTMPLSGTLSKSHTQPPFFDHITISEPKSCTQLCLTCSIISLI